MTAVPDIRVTPVTPALATAVRALRVAADQYAYVGDIDGQSGGRRTHAEKRSDGDPRR